MFDTPFDEMTAVVVIESAAAGMAFRHGAAEIVHGSNRISGSDALALVRKLDRLSLGVPKHEQKKWRALRNQFVFAFGPDLESRI